MKWYDLVAPVYDGAVRSLYLPYRQKAVRSIHLQPGHTVLDLGCGSGLNFELIMEGIGPQGTLIGVDFSAKMLEPPCLPARQIRKRPEILPLPPSCVC